MLFSVQKSNYICIQVTSVLHLYLTKYVFVSPFVQKYEKESGTSTYDPFPPLLLRIMLHPCSVKNQQYCISFEFAAMQQWSTPKWYPLYDSGHATEVDSSRMY